MKRVHLDVTVEPGSEPIRGILDDGRGTAIEFSGWLELMSAFDTARAGATGAGSATDPPTAEP